MAVVKMKRIELVGLNRERKRVFEYLQSCGCVDFSAGGIGDNRVRTAEAISRFESNMAQLDRALKLLPERGKKAFPHRKDKAGAAYSAGEGEITRAVAIAAEIIRISKENAERAEEAAKTEMTERLLAPYSALDLSPALCKTRRTQIRLGTIAGAHTAESLYAEFADGGADEIYIEIINAAKEQTTIWLMYSDCNADKAEAVLARLDFSAAKKLSDRLVSDRLAECAERRGKIAAQNAEAAARLCELTAERDFLELTYDRLAVRRDKYRALAETDITEKAFFTVGYVPESRADKLAAQLREKFTLDVRLAAPDADEDIPSAFENGFFASPVEGITADYSMPSSHDIDPNPIMAIFYYFFFGMMFSDAGYGILMMLVCGFLGYSGLLEKEKRRTFKMFFMCGVSTTFWGLMYGSFFGDMLSTVSSTFGKGALSLSPVLVDPVKKPLTVLIISIAFGVVHIVTAMAIKMYMTLRGGDPFAAICDTGFWILLILGLSAAAVGAAADITPLYHTGIAAAIAAAVGLVLTQGRGKKNPIMRLLGGILSLYDITSIIGDILSYSRLMALGLATGVIASVVNVLASLGGGGAVGLMVFIAISIFGHSLNFAINMLGAYVHTNRLQYVEFYQKFYEGGGRKFSPLTYNTKYYNF